MSPEVSERSFEEAIEVALLRYGPDPPAGDGPGREVPPAYGEMAPGGDHRRTICVEHFATKVQREIGGRAKAMIVTRSRLHAVRYKLAIDRYLTERGYPFRAVVAFSGSVQDGGQSYTEAGMNGFPEAQSAKTFEQPGYRP